MDAKLTYTQAMARLEKIIRQIESNELDIDALAQHITEAKELISFCKDKLDKTDSQVEKLIN